MYIYSYRKFFETEPGEAEQQQPHHSASQSPNQTQNTRNAAKAQICTQSENTSHFQPSQPSAWQEGLSGRVSYCLTSGEARTGMRWKTTCRWRPDEEGRSGTQAGCELSEPSFPLFSPAAAAEDCFPSLGTFLLGTGCCVCLFNWRVIYQICFRNFLAWDPHWGVGLGVRAERPLVFLKVYTESLETFRAGISSLHLPLCLIQQCISWAPFPKAYTGDNGKSYGTGLDPLYPWLDSIYFTTLSFFTSVTRECPILSPVCLHCSMYST